MPLDDFGAVDAGPTARLVAMMHATDAWPAVQRLREWVLDTVEVRPGSLVVDVGSGPGTFSRLAAARGAATVDVDPSATMLAAVRAARPNARVVRAALEALPLRPAAVDVLRAERVLQWTEDAAGALAGLWALVPPRGWLAVTDTDWGSFTLDHPDPGVRDRIDDAAHRWVRHPRLAADLPDLIAAGEPTRLEWRRDRVVVDAWAPDDAAQATGPPGLPLRSIAPDDADAVEAVAHEARQGRFHATLDLVTVVARR